MHSAGRSSTSRKHEFALERFANDLLPVVDNLERAVESSTGADADGIEAVVEGVELTLKAWSTCWRRMALRLSILTVSPLIRRLHRQ